MSAPASELFPVISFQHESYSASYPSLLIRIGEGSANSYQTKKKFLSLMQNVTGIEALVCPVCKKIGKWFAAWIAFLIQ